MRHHREPQPFLRGLASACQPSLVGDGPVLCHLPLPLGQVPLRAGSVPLEVQAFVLWEPTPQPCCSAELGVEKKSSVAS